MKRLILIAISVGIFAAACQTDYSSDNVVVNAERGFVLNVSLSATRTSLGEKANDTYPCYWSEGDQIVVNGELSSAAEINKENKASATFSFPDAIVTYPINITYPYYASTTSSQPIVEFKQEQTYTKGTFCTNSAPLCGYSAKEGANITLNHLTSVLRLPVKSKSEGVKLEKIVITSVSGAKLSGKFKVDCQNATIEATEEAQNSITYSLPANYTLSTTEESIFYISIPATSVGSCTVEFIDSSGDKMVANWTTSEPLFQGAVREFSTITYQPNISIILQPMEAESDDIYYGDKVYGYVRYSDGSPIANVSISDGFQITTTDSNGYYRLSGLTSDVFYIYCSIPADVKVPINEHGQPCFFKKFPSNTSRYDFTFEKLPGGVEEEFAVFAMADPQPNTHDDITRFNIQAAPVIKSYANSLGIPCYGVMLGDIVNVLSSTSIEREHMMPYMRSAMSVDNIGMPVFAVFGNHDNAFFSSSNPIYADERSSTYNLKIQRPFEECFGPVDYSFNRGNAHFVVLRNTHYTSNTAASEFDNGLTKQQFEWFKQDIANVSRDKMIVLCVHVQMFNKKYNYIQEVLSLMDEFSEAHILSGHIHANEPYDHKALNTGHKVYEHNIAAINGVKWVCNVTADGAPNGNKVLYAKGNKFVNWYYKGYPYGMSDRNYQMRLYRGGSITGAEKSGSDKQGTKGYYQFPYDNGVVLANIFSSDPWNWRAEVYEDGVYSGNMTSLYKYRAYVPFDELIGDGSFENPRRVDSSKVTDCAHDFYATGVMLGKLGTKTDLHYEKACWTMWKYVLKNPDAKHIEVRAYDQFGNVYSESNFQDGTDMTYSLYNPDFNP